MTGKGTDRRGRPGVSREQRLSDEGLLRLERQLREGGNVSDMVLRQWIRRYGDAAKDLIRQYGRYSSELDD